MSKHIDRLGFEYELPNMVKFSSVPDGEVIVSMVEHNGKVVVASDKYVYVMEDDGVMRRVMFEVPANE